MVRCVLWSEKYGILIACYKITLRTPANYRHDHQQHQNSTSYHETLCCLFQNHCSWMLPTVLLCFLLLIQIWNSHLLSGRKCTTILHLCWYVNVLNANLPTIFHYKICLHINIIYKYVLKLSWWQISAKSSCANSHVKLFKSTDFQRAGIYPSEGSDIRTMMTEMLLAFEMSVDLTTFSSCQPKSILLTTENVHL